MGRVWVLRGFGWLGTYIKHHVYITYTYTYNMFIYSMYIFPYLHDEYTGILVYSLASKQPSLPSLSPSPISYRSKSLSVKATLLALKVRGATNWKLYTFHEWNLGNFWEICPNFHHHSVYQSLTLNFHHHRIIKNHQEPLAQPPKTTLLQDGPKSPNKRVPPTMATASWKAKVAGVLCSFRALASNKKWPWEIWPTHRKETGNIQDRHVIVTVILSAVIHHRHLRETLWAFFVDFFGDCLSCRETLEKPFGKTGGIDKKIPVYGALPPFEESRGPESKVVIHQFQELQIWWFQGRCPPNSVWKDQVE